MNGEIDVVWSYILDCENDQNPFEEKRSAIEQWKKLACADIEETESLIEMANRLVGMGIRSNAHEGRIPSPRKMKDPYGGDSGTRSINSLET
uniref:Uncharacterized protein n=1 Tax=Candidatus Kentrum sp. SD TaxID=2126332 RepID=A0A451BS25_9GAMM|nr:MAG: hypothetical protein BECKSD772D_GA0070982_12261 [Candidatus Kentron sp. SD]